MHLYASNVAAELESKSANCADGVCPCSIVESEKKLDGEKEPEECCKENVTGEVRVV